MSSPSGQRVVNEPETIIERFNDNGWRVTYVLASLSRYNTSPRTVKHPGAFLLQYLPVSYTAIKIIYTLSSACEKVTYNNLFQIVDAGSAEVAIRVSLWFPFSRLIFQVGNIIIDIWNY